MIVAVLAEESLHRPSAVRMDGRFEFLPEKRKCRILADFQLGLDLSRIYTGLLTREFVAVGGGGSSRAQTGAAPASGTEPLPQGWPAVL